MTTSTLSTKTLKSIYERSLSPTGPFRPQRLVTPNISALDARVVLKDRGVHRKGERWIGTPKSIRIKDREESILMKVTRMLNEGVISVMDIEKVLMEVNNA